MSVMLPGNPVSRTSYILRAVIATALIVAFAIVSGIVDVPFEKPRDISLLLTPEFNALVARVRNIFSTGKDQ